MGKSLEIHYKDHKGFFGPEFFEFLGPTSKGQEGQVRIEAVGQQLLGR